MLNKHKVIERMKITRLDGDRYLTESVDRIKIEVGGEEFTLTERFGKLRIHKHHESIRVYPCVSNEIDID